MPLSQKEQNLELSDAAVVDGRVSEIASDLRISALANTSTWLGRVLWALGPLLDRIIGIRGIRRVYEDGGFQGMNAKNFCDRGIEYLNVDVVPDASFADRIPKEGPVVVACNHPYGGIEGLMIAQAMLRVRPDVKVMANEMLGYIQELREILILADPLATSTKNIVPIREATNHLSNGGLVVVFPAGRVSGWQEDKGRITDYPWHRLVGHLVKASDACMVPLFISGANSELFQKAGKLNPKLRMLMLPREMLKISGRRVELRAGRPVESPALRDLKPAEIARTGRLLMYQNEKPEVPPPTAVDQSELKPLAPAVDPAQLEAEIQALPPKQQLLTFKQFVVAYSYQDQTPGVVDEIALRREQIYRYFDEGSGEPSDTDRFDATYVQLYVWDTESKSLVGAYRMGRTDDLRKTSGPEGIYLTQMFDFDESFYTDLPPALEMGRSFIIPEHQRSYYALRLLWQGIGQYLYRYPHYRRLYGTVSISNQYSPASIAMMCDGLIEENSWVKPRVPVPFDLHPEWHEFKANEHPVPLGQLSALVRASEAEATDVPILLKQYHRLGAKFLTVGYDPNFNSTPGLLLDIDVPNVPAKTMRSFLGKDVDLYLSGQGIEFD